MRSARFFALATLALAPGCGGDDTAMAPTTTTTYAVAADVPLVLARHDRGEDLPRPEPCIVSDYVGVPDGAGGRRPDYRHHSPEEALQGFLQLRLEGRGLAPPRGYHWVPGRSGTGTFVYASGDEVGATVTVDRHGDLYGVTDNCGGANGPPDARWRPPPPKA